MMIKHINKLHAFLFLLFLGFIVQLHAEDEIRELMKEVRDIDQDIRNEVGDFDHYYERAKNVISKSGTLYNKYVNDVTGSYDRFNNYLMTYKPNNVEWGHRAALKHHRIDINSEESLDEFADYAEDILKRLERETDFMKSLAENLEKSYADSNSNTVQYYKTYQYYTPNYYRHSYYWPYSGGYYYKNHNYPNHHNSGHGSFGIHFRIK